MGILIDYSIINLGINDLKQMLNDTSVYVSTGRLGSEISYSQSDYVEILLQEVDAIKEIENIVRGMIEDSYNMLCMAKTLYKDGDREIRDLISTKEN